MTTVRVEEYGTGRALELDEQQTRAFERELEAVRQRPPGEGVAPRVGADCTITVTTDGAETVYRLYSRAVLLELETNRSWQFYFGFLLVEWLRAAP